MIDKALFLVYNIIVAMSEDIIGYMQTYRSGHNGADSKSCDPFIKTAYFYTEWYRSGRNELDSKSSCPQGHVGSNPTHSARKSLKRNASRTSILPEDFSIPIVSSIMVPMVPRFVVPGQ